MKKNVGILIFDGAEVLDFAGPFEVFAVASEVHNFELFNVFTVSKKKSAISAVNGLSVNPTYDFEDCPPIDILIIAGGDGTNDLIHDKEVLRWVNKIHLNTDITASICSGSRILGKLRLLDHQPYCTHHQVYEDMQNIVPSGLPQKDKRYVQAGKIYSSGGISAGIDLSFHIVESIQGEEVANNTANYMEYRRMKF